MNAFDLARQLTADTAGNGPTADLLVELIRDELRNFERANEAILRLADSIKRDLDRQMDAVNGGFMASNFSKQTMDSLTEAHAARQQASDQLRMLTFRLAEQTVGFDADEFWTVAAKLGTQA